MEICVCLFSGQLLSLFPFLSSCAFPCHPPWDWSGSRCCCKGESSVVKECCPFIGICMDWLTWFPWCLPPTESIVGGTRLFTGSIFCWFLFFYVTENYHVAFRAVWQRLHFSLYVFCFPYILLCKGSHLCLKTRSVCKSVCDDWDEECEWVEKNRRHVFVAYSLSVLPSLSECVTQ